MASDHDYIIKMFIYKTVAFSVGGITEDNLSAKSSEKCSLIIPRVSSDRFFTITKESVIQQNSLP